MFSRGVILLPTLEKVLHTLGVITEITVIIADEKKELIKNSQCPESRRPHIDAEIFIKKNEAKAYFEIYCDYMREAQEHGILS